jgi:hypothetical protein
MVPNPVSKVNEGPFSFRYKRYNHSTLLRCADERYQHGSITCFAVFPQSVVSNLRLLQGYC